MDETFPFSIVDNTTDQATDYTFPPTFSDGVTYDPVTMEVTVPAGVTSFTVTTPTTDDLIDEGDENYTITIGGETATGTIVDNDEVVVADITDATEQEGDDLTFSVTMSGESALDQEYPFDITDVTATLGDDYEGTPVFTNGVTYDPVTMTITVPAGVVDFEVTFPGLDDLIDEDDETFTLTIGGESATGTIIDNDEVMVVAIDDVVANEGDDLTFVVDMSGVSDMDQTYPFDITDITATQGDDYDGTPVFSNGVTYDPVTMTITIPAGVEDFTVTFPGIDDVIAEDDETFTINIDGVEATGTIIDDDINDELGSVEGHLYLDINNNGIQDAGEPDLEGVEILITDSNGDTQVVITDENGDYIADVIAGLTIVDINEATLPGGAVQTEGTDPTTVNVLEGGVNFEENNGYNVPTDGAVTGIVYNDTNGNGVQDAGEPGLEGVEILVTDVNGDTQIVITDVNGNYTVTVPAGNVIIDIDETTLPVGSTQTEGTDPTTVTVIATETTFEENNGFNVPSNGTITGVVYNDVNGNGIQDAGELGIEGVEILVTDVNGDTQIVITDADGDYSVFVPAGNTIIDIDESTLPVGAIQTEGTDPTTVNAIAGEETIEENNGYNVTLNGTIVGHVYNDLNGNGIQDAGEPDLEGVEILVTDVNGDTQIVITDENGNYSVSVPAGDTIIDIDETTLPAGAIQTEGTDPTTVTAIAGDTVTEEDNGYQEPDQAGTIEGHVYNDLNANGIQDAGEPDLENVAVFITDTDGIVQTVFTDVNGDYVATVVGNQNATVDIDETTLPAGFIQTEGTDPTTVTVPSGGTVFEENNGYTLQATPNLDLSKIGVINDLNGNGIVDAGETITYTLTVTNTGNVDLTDVFVTDPLIIINEGPIALLEIGDSAIFTGVYTITQDDIETGGVFNIATAEGTDPTGNTVIDLSDDPTDTTNTDDDGDGDGEDPTVTIFNLAPNINLLKTGVYQDFNANGLTDAGDQITYTFEITNTGNVILNNVIVTDPLVTVIGDPVTLLPGETAIFTAVYTITQQDVINGEVVNTAQGIGITNNGEQITDASDDPTDTTSDDDDPTVTVLNQNSGLIFNNGISITSERGNDVFRIEGIERFPDNRLRIFNRWGVEVYNAENYDNDVIGFRGLSEGRTTISQDKFLPVGTYYYILEYVNSEGRTINNSGYLYITR